MMTRERKQADLLADYQERLFEDADTLPPPGLDRYTAEMAARMARGARPPGPSTGFVGRLRGDLERQASRMAVTSGESGAFRSRGGPASTEDRAAKRSAPVLDKRSPRRARQTKRHWLREWAAMAAGAAVLVVVGVVLATILSSQGGGGGQKEPGAASGPAQTVPTATTNTGAATETTVATTPAASVPGLGKLAAVVGDKLVILDGNAPASENTHELAGPVLAPAWSPSGDWLAYLQPSAPDSQAGSLWLVRADAIGAAQVEGLPGPVSVGQFAWSPSTDSLAIASDQGLLLVTAPGQPARSLTPDGAAIGSFAWSKDGQTLAYSTTIPSANPSERSDAIYTLKVATDDQPSQVFVADGDGVELAGWWPDGAGLLFWRVPLHSQSLAADGLPLESLTLSDGTTQKLATMLPRRDWISWGSDAEHVTVVAGQGRWIGGNKTVQTCNITTGNCLPVQGENTEMVSFDPARSPDGTHLAYVRGASVPQSQVATDSSLRAYRDGLQLWMQGSGSTSVQKIDAAGKDIRSPIWSSDNQHLLYLRGNDIWMLDVESGKATQVLTDTATANAWDPWGSVVAWQP